MSINGMGKIEFGKFYNANNKIINSLDETPILDSILLKEVSPKRLRKLLDNDFLYYQYHAYKQFIRILKNMEDSVEFGKMFDELKK